LFVTTPQADRDQTVDRLLRRAMHPGAVPDASDRCLDAETAAAWVDGALPGDAAALAEAHASTCARCQAMLAALVRASPPLPRAESWWRRRWVIAGLVPLTAGAAAIAIWVATPKDATRILPPSVQGGTQPPAAARTLPSTPAASPTETARPPAREKTPPLVDRLETSTAREERATAAPSPERRQQSADARRDEQAKPPASLDAAASAPSPLNESVAQFRRAVGLIEIASPDGSIRWRIGAAGMVQRSSDGGATWEMLSSGATEDLTAASAPSATVCWIAGRAGTLLLVTNGREWQRVAFPERVDLAAVQATDSRTATVTTIDGRTFRTADGGRTWTVERPNIHD
jgi:Photosynthesis system II assembly factor YCF48